MALLEPAGSKKSRYQVNIPAGNSPYHLLAKTDGTNFLYQWGADCINGEPNRGPDLKTI